MAGRRSATALTVGLLTGSPLPALGETGEKTENSTTTATAARSLRGSYQCVTEDSVCGLNGGKTAQCCAGLQCEPWQGSFDTMRCLADGYGPSPAPPPYRPPHHTQHIPVFHTCRELGCGYGGEQSNRYGDYCACNEECQQEGTCCTDFWSYCEGSPPPPPPYSPYRPPYSPPPAPPPYSPYRPPYSPPPAPPPYNPPYAPWRPPASGFGSSFELRYAGQRNTCMDVAGGHDKNFDKIQVWACHHPENQMFYFERMHGYSGYSGRIRWARDTSKCLDVKYGKTDVVIYNCHPDNSPFLDNQVFDVEAFANRGSTHIRWKGKCVDLNRGIVGSRHSHNSQVIVYDCHPYGSSGWIHQQWNVEYGA